MKNNKQSILYIVNSQGEIQAVQLAMSLWEKVEAYVKKIDQSSSIKVDPFTKPEPLDALKELKDYWDFTYPYDPHVFCEACNASTDDWENDPSHPFHLSNANIGGLLVFQCRCGATVRKKHFHRKFVFECSPKTDN